MTLAAGRLARRVRRAAAGALIAAFGASAGSDRAPAVEVACIEASKYKYLYRIFDDDRRKFAEFLQLDAAQLPGPEACRAIALWGRIEPHKREDGKPDFDRLYAVIAANRGWLSTIYLASGGGNIGEGFRLAQLTRMFWLKTHAVEHNAIDYTPDFLASEAKAGSQAASRAVDVPPELSSGWNAYVRRIDENRRIALDQRGRCASACTFLHVAGVDRHGVAYFHRGRPSKPAGSAATDADRSMADVQEGLLKAEMRVLDLYRQMDGGDEIIRLFKETSTLTFAPAVIPRSPRYVADLLRTRCRGDIENPPPGRRHQIERCVAAAHEKERLRQFAKHCAGGCDRSAVLRAVEDRIRTLAPESRTAPSPRREADDPRRR